MMIHRLRALGFILLSTSAASADEYLAARTLPVGSIIRPGDIQTRANDAEPGPAEIVGLEVRRAIYAGRPIPRTHLGPPTLIRRNEIVTMSYRYGPMALRTEGRALSSGGAGEHIDVINLASRAVVRAIVRGPHRVEVRR